MGGFSLIVVLYLVVPGFIADTFFRYVRGMDKGGELERVLRSLVWSVFVLSLYLLLIGEPPEYLKDLGTANASPTFSRANLLQLAAHSLFATGVAGATAMIVESKKVRTKLQSIFARSLAERVPWDLMFGEHRAGRLVRVQRKDGPTYVGFLLTVSTGSAERSVVLYDPSIVTEGQAPKKIEDARLLYIAGSEIAEIRLAPTQEEENAAKPRE